jgi:hypothetical protein
MAAKAVINTAEQLLPLLATINAIIVITAVMVAISTTVRLAAYIQDMVTKAEISTVAQLAERLHNNMMGIQAGINTIDFFSKYSHFTVNRGMRILQNCFTRKGRNLKNLQFYNFKL